MCELNPIIKKNLKILFIGLNPHPKSCENGVYFSSNRSFWIQLFEAGITPEQIIKKDFKAGDDRKLLKYNFGITDLVHRATKRFQKGLWNKKERIRLNKEIEFAKPKVVCFLGKESYQIYFGKKCSKYGQQQNFMGYKIFVAMFPTGRGFKHEKLKLLKELKDF